MRKQRGEEGGSQGKEAGWGLCAGGGISVSGGCDSGCAYIKEAQNLTVVSQRGSARTQEVSVRVCTWVPVGRRVVELVSDYGLGEPCPEDTRKP